MAPRETYASDEDWGIENPFVPWNWRQASSKLVDAWFKDIQDLQHLEGFVSAAIDTDRSNTGVAAEQEMHAWAHELADNCGLVILIHGYSSTVRRMIAHHMLSDDNLKLLHSKRIRPKIVSLRTSDVDALDARAMTNDLRQSGANSRYRAVFKLKRYEYLETTTADLNGIRQLDDGSTYFLLVMGAEAFDRGETILQQRTAGQSILDYVLTELPHADQEDHYQAWVVAEGYKRLDVSVMTRDLQEFAHHLPRISMTNLDAYKGRAKLVSSLSSP